MGPGRADQEWPTSPPRLVPQSDGYADYIDQSQAGPAGPPAGLANGQQGAAGNALARGLDRSRPAHAGHRKDRRVFRGASRSGRQRSIRSTITILLVIPLLSLIALWAYAAVSTVGGAIANRNDNTLNQELGAPIAALVAALQAEGADTFVWQKSHALYQSAHGRLPAKAVEAMNASKAAMDAQRPRTDAAITDFKAAAKQAASLEPAGDKPEAATLIADLNGVPRLRAKVDAGTMPALTAFEDYVATGYASDPYAGGLSNTDGSSIAEYSQGQAVLQEGEAAEDIGEEASLVGGVLAGGGIMSPAEHSLFVQTVDNQRLLESLGAAPIDWQESPDPYAPVDASPAFKNLQTLEDKIAAGRPGAPLPVSPTAWEAGVGTVFDRLNAAETATRGAITSGQARASDAVVRNVIVVGGAGLLAVIVSSVLLLGFGNRISRELTGLRGAARTLADERLPSVVGRLRAGRDVDVAVEAPPLDLGTRTREVTETADAFSAVQRTAVEAAVEQAQLRSGVSRVFRSLARRNQSLLQRQLKLLDEMERATEDPDALSQLFRLDHLTTRMRRQAEGLIILSGAAPGRTWRQPVPVVEVLRGAIGEIEDFARVELVTDSPDFVQGTAVADVTHMLAELIENAVQYSPPGTSVQVRGGRVANGYALEIEDRGLGIPPDTMNTLNQRLAKPPEFDLADSDQLGLFVVSRLAARHGVRISLRVSGYGGTSAVVLLPRALVVAENEVPFLPGKASTEAAGWDGAGPSSALAAGQPAGRGLGTAAQALAGRRMLRPERGLNQASPGSTFGDAPSAAAAGGLAGSAGSGTGGLPRRAPQTNMAPQLRGGRPGAPAGPLAGRSPEHARSLMSAIQQGLRSGRAAGTPDETDSRTGGEDPPAASGWSQ
ncbi:MAG: nitrate- and nitrite sensing domain-containing protein [Trebonia sp.]|jgi:signal transduction histidine kinase